MPENLDKPNVGDKVVLVAVPPAFDELPDADQCAIAAMVGKPLELTGWENGKAVLHFPDAARSGHHLTIWVPAEFIAPHRE